MDHGSLDRFLARPLTWRAVVALAGLVRVAFVIAPFDVLAPVDAHVLGRWMLEGQLPYRDFALEYPPGALLAFVLPGLAPSSVAPAVLALQALAADVVIMWVLRSTGRAALRRYVALSTLLFPLASGGFDLLAAASIVLSLHLLERGDRRGLWWAAVGAALKLFPGAVWGATRRWGRTGVAALAAALAALAAPLFLASGRDVYIGYHADRGVQQESVAASLHYLTQRLTGGTVEVRYRFRSQELLGAEGWAAVTFAVFAVMAAVLAIRCWTRAEPTDTWRSALALLLVVLCGAKVLSPQFLLLGGPLAARASARTAAAYLALAALTVGAFTDEAKGDAFMAVVALRNLGLVMLTSALWWSSVRPDAPVSAAATIPRLLFLRTERR